MQWIMVNGTAFVPGAYADIKFFKVTGKYSPISPVFPTNPEILRIHGKPDKYESVPAEDLNQAIKAGKNLEIRYVRVSGDLNFAGIGRPTCLTN